MIEIWKPVVGYEGLYEVSNLGRVKSLNYRRTGKEGILSQGKCKNGYSIVGLYKNEKRKPYYVHRLVAEAFIPNPENLPEVNHIIDDFEHRSDNRVENLEWCTVEYNNTYNDRHKRAGNKIKGKYIGDKSPRAKKVKCITTGEIFEAVREAGRKYNIDATSICRCCQDKRNYAGKHPITKERLVWEYID